MKEILISVMLFLQVVAFGQSLPDQQLIPEYVLKGKSSIELRLMRNEIFARYGYIFQSSELVEYFGTKPWYQPLFINVDDKLTPTDRTNIQLIRKFENIAEDNLSKPEYLNETVAYSRIFIDFDNQQKYVKTRNVSFHYHFEFGMIRKIVERTDYGGEYIPTVVYAETAAPNKIFWNTTKYFSDITFHTRYYKAIRYGCCGSEDYNEFYSYKSEEPFLTFNEKYFIVDIPNSKINLFVGYNHEETSNDELKIGTLYFSTLDGVVSSISFEANSLEVKKDIIWYFSPDIQLKTNKENNKIINNGKEIRLWSCHTAKSIADINDFSLTITFISERTGKQIIIDVPVINGRFFGGQELHTKRTINL